MKGDDPPATVGDDRTTYSVVPPGENPPVPPEHEKECIPQVTMEAAPPMRGGLHPNTVGVFRIAKNELIPLVADGADADQIIFDCIPANGCPETGSQRKEGLTSYVGYVWRSVNTAEFVGGGLFSTSSDAGSASLNANPKSYLDAKVVLYQHPEVTREKPAVRSRLTLDIEDRHNEQPADEDVELVIDIFVHLIERELEDSVEIRIIGPVFDRYSNPVKTESIGTCEAKPLEWTQPRDLNITTQPIPVYSRSKNTLSASAVDTDLLELKCESTCEGFTKQIGLGDEVILQWEVLSGGGCFMTGPGTCVDKVWGEDVIFQAPELANGIDSATVKILVKGYNQSGGHDPYSRTPLIHKAMDLMDVDTMTIRVLCRPRETTVLVGWSDRFLDHDDPDHIDTLMINDQSALIGFNRECKVELNKAIADWSSETHYFDLNASGFVPNVWFGYRHIYASGNAVYLYDYGFVSDLDLPPSATTWLEEFKRTMEMAAIAGKFIAWLLHELPQLKAETASELFNQIAEKMGIDPGIWQKGGLDEYTRQMLLNEVMKTLSDGHFTQSRELGFIFSSWVLSPKGEGDCDQSCPVDVSHQTIMTLGDTDHYYKRSSQVIVNRIINNQIVHEPHSFSKELKGDRYPR